MRIRARVATTVALAILPAPRSWAQGRDSAGSSGPSPMGSDGSASTIIAFAILALLIVAIVVLAKYMSARKKRQEEAVVLESQLSDALLREVQLRGLQIVPRSHIDGWRHPQLTIEIVGEVPTPEARETVMQIARNEVRRLRPDVAPVDHLFIAPPRRQP